MGNEDPVWINEDKAESVAKQTSLLKLTDVTGVVKYINPNSIVSIMPGVPDGSIRTKAYNLLKEKNDKLIEG